MNNARWMEQANCQGTDADAFFPVKGERNTSALRICHRCQVRSECLEWAIATYETGVWGGTSEEQRKAIRRQRKQEQAA